MDNPGAKGLLSRLLRRFRPSARRNPEPGANQHTHPFPPQGAPASSAGMILIIELRGWACGPLPLLLGQGDYETRVVQGHEAALDVLNRRDPVLLIVGGTASPKFYHALRQATPAPILALAPQGDAEQAISAFAAGVDQYQAGPISSSEVAARARAVLRRATSPVPTPTESQ
jgi:DNA-binding response OmpR family regulator